MAMHALLKSISVFTISTDPDIHNVVSISQLPWKLDLTTQNYLKSQLTTVNYTISRA